MCLNELEKKFMIRGKVKKLFDTGFFHVFGSSIINKITTFLSTIVLVRVISKQEYGVFSYAWNIYSIILLFSGFGIASGVLQICSERSANKDLHMQVYQFGIRFGTLIDFLLAFLIVIITLFIPLPIEGSNRILCLMCFLPMLSLWAELLLTYLRSTKQNKSYGWISTISALLFALFTVLGAIYFEAIGMVIGRYIASMLVIFISIVFFRVPFVKIEHVRINEKDKRDTVRISAISMLNNGLSQMLYLADVFVIGLVLTNSAEVASYKIATQIPNALSFIPLAAITYVYPYFAEHNQDKEWCMKRYKQLTVAMGVLNIIISLVLILFAPLIVSILFGEQYLDAVPAFRILSFSYFFSGTFRVICGNILVTQRKLKFNTLVAVVSGIINIISDVLFVSLWGANGAAIATLTVVIVSSIMSTIYLIKVLLKTSVKE